MSLMKNNNVKLLIIAYFIDTIAVAYLLGYYLNITINDIGGPELLGFFSMANNFFASFIPIIAGAFSDAHGRKGVIVVSTVFEVLSLLALGIIIESGSVLVIIPAILLNVAFMASSPAIVSLIGESVSVEYLGRALSLIFLANNAASIISYLAFGSLLSVVSISNLFLLSGFTVLVAITLYLRISETLRPNNVQSNVLEPLKGIFKGVKFVREPHLKLFLIYISFEFFIGSIATAFVPVFLQNVYSLSVSEISWLYSLITLFTIGGTLMAGYVVDKYGSVKSLILKDTLSIPLLGIFALALSPVALLSLIFLSFIEQLKVASERYVVENTNPEYRGLILGVKNSLTRIFSVPGPMLGFFLWNVSPKMTFLAPAGLTPLGILILVMLKKIRENERVSRV
ncbi:MFS transporter [Thermococcus sp. M36]|nr:MFS transporter [Thermococcus sp. M36]